MNLYVATLWGAILVWGTILKTDWSSAASEHDLPTSFWWYYRADPEGWREWYQVDQSNWVEKYDIESRFSVKGRGIVNGCAGMLMLKDDQSLQVFVPERGCSLQNILFQFMRAAGPTGPWTLLGFLQNTSYDAGNTLPRPREIAKDPVLELEDSIFAAIEQPPKGRLEVAAARLKFWAAVDAGLSHCGINSRFFERASSAAKNCLRSAQLRQAMVLFAETKEILERYRKVALPGCDQSEEMIEIGRRVLDQAAERIERTCR
jgi:hypothetical protein